jgi:cell wall-associated NlpC family hydrolase
MRDSLIAAARSYLNVPFVFHGRTPAGLDCWGLVRLVCDKYTLMPGLDFPYRKMSQTRDLFTTLLPKAGAVPIGIQNAQYGDLVLLCDYSHREMVHCGFLAERYGAPSLIHASVIAGKVVEVSFTGIYKRIAFSAYRLPGVE